MNIKLDSLWTCLETMCFCFRSNINEPLLCTGSRISHAWESEALHHTGSYGRSPIPDGEARLEQSPTVDGDPRWNPWDGSNSQHGRGKFETNICNLDEKIRLTFLKLDSVVRWKQYEHSRYIYNWHRCPYWSLLREMYKWSGSLLTMPLHVSYWGVSGWPSGSMYLVGSHAC